MRRYSWRLELILAPREGLGFRQIIFYDRSSDFRVEGPSVTRQTAKDGMPAKDTKVSRRFSVRWAIVEAFAYILCIRRPSRRKRRRNMFFWH